MSSAGERASAPAATSRDRGRMSSGRETGESATSSPGRGSSGEQGSGGREDGLGYRLQNARQTASGFLHKALLR
jgi:hypothetical protein